MQAPTPHTIHLTIGLVQFVWDEILLGEGSWTSCQGDHECLVDPANSEMSFSGFISQLQHGLGRTGKATVTDWISPTEKGYWLISHVHSHKAGTPQEIVNCSEGSLSEMTLLSEALLSLALLVPRAIKGTVDYITSDEKADTSYL